MAIFFGSIWAILCYIYFTILDVTIHTVFSVCCSSKWLVLCAICASNLSFEVDVTPDVSHSDAGDHVSRRRLEAVRVERPLLVAHLHVVLVLHRPLETHRWSWLPLSSFFPYATLNE